MRVCVSRVSSDRALNAVNGTVSPLAGRLAGAVSTYDQDYDPE
jgi:hypothetical protein